MDKGITINWEHLNEHLAIARVGRDGMTAIEAKKVGSGLWKWKLLGIDTEIFGYAVDERDACNIAGRALDYYLNER